jgi:glycosyltransferase involved in cell wall biosynthesis
MAASEAIERQMWAKCDGIYYLSEEECDFIRSAHPDRSVQVIPPFLYQAARLQDVRERLATSGIPRSRQLLFVGGFHHRPNVDAMLWFVREVWPRIESEVPDCRLCIAGSFPSPEIEALAGPAIDVTGFITDGALAARYASAQVAIVPLRFGAGVKGKIIEALSHGTPVVSTSVGAEGLPGMREVLDVCDRPDDFARMVVDILRDPASRLAKALAGVDFVEAVTSATTARKVLAADIPELRPGAARFG